MAGGAIPALAGQIVDQTGAAEKIDESIEAAKSTVCSAANEWC
jgi:hypothetical protein